MDKVKLDFWLALKIGAGFTVGTQLVLVAMRLIERFLMAVEGRG